jgi:hypothetical protein
MQATPPPTPTPAIAPAIAQGPSTANANAVYEGFIHQRDELRDQLSRLNDRREEISGQLQDPNVSGANKQGLEGRLQQIDARIADVEKQIAASDAQVASAAAVPGAIIEVPPPEPRGPPDQVYVLAGMFIVVVLFPIAFAFARRIWKRTSSAVAAIPQELFDRFTRVETSLDAIAIEVERLGEGQRYVTRVLTDRAALGPGAAERVDVAERDKQRERR